jgi:chromosome partitioning protein
MICNTVLIIIKEESQMGAKIICVCNQKGGSGKNTLAMHFAGALSLRRVKVLLVDGD